MAPNEGAKARSGRHVSSQKHLTRLEKPAHICVVFSTVALQHLLLFQKRLKTGIRHCPVLRKSMTYNDLKCQPAARLC